MTAPPNLRRFLERAPLIRPGENCDMCGEPLAEAHGHLVELAARRLRCTCRPCQLLFDNPGAAGGRFKTVPERYLSAPAYRLPTRSWDQLTIPVQLAFFFRNSVQDRVVAFYPSPAGATESLLAMESWHEVMADNPLVPLLEEDVEGLIVRRHDDGCVCYLVPIDVCYELVGVVRSHWRGFDGGTEAWAHVDAFFTGLESRSSAVDRVGDGEDRHG